MQKYFWAAYNYASKDDFIARATGIQKENSGTPRIFRR